MATAASGSGQFFHVVRNRRQTELTSKTLQQLTLRQRHHLQHLHSLQSVSNLLNITTHSSIYSNIKISNFTISNISIPTNDCLSVPGSPDPETYSNTLWYIGVCRSVNARLGLTEIVTTVTVSLLLLKEVDCGIQSV